MERKTLHKLLLKINLKCKLKNFASGAFSEALNHSSLNSDINHEKLEFLGDAVLRLACSEFLGEHKPELNVGERSALRGQLVSDRWLSEVARKIKLSEFIRQSSSSSQDIAAQPTIEADCCEALIGAVYLTFGGPDGGLHAVRQWLDPHWLSSCIELEQDPTINNWKSVLQELTQSTKGGLPSYITTEESSNHGDPRRFRSVVSVNAKERGCGWGASRRLAEQEAAREALEQLKPPSGS